MAAYRDVIWVALLAVTQAGDLWTTAIDRAKGATESMPLTATVLAERGLLGLACLKVLLLLAFVAALALARSRPAGSRHAGSLHAFVLFTCRISAMALGIVMLHNAALFATM